MRVQNNLDQIKNLMRDNKNVVLAKKWKIKYVFTSHRTQTILSFFLGQFSNSQIKFVFRLILWQGF